MNKLGEDANNLYNIIEKLYYYEYNDILTEKGFFCFYYNNNSYYIKKVLKKDYDIPFLPTLRPFYYNEYVIIMLLPNDDIGDLNFNEKMRNMISEMNSELRYKKLENIYGKY